MYCVKDTLELKESSRAALPVEPTHSDLHGVLLVDWVVDNVVPAPLQMWETASNQAND